MNKKLMALLLVVVILVGGCGTPKEEEVTETTEEVVAEEEIEEESSTEEDEEGLPESFTEAFSVEEEPELLHPVTVGETYYRYIADTDTTIFTNMIFDEHGFTLNGFGYTGGVYDDSLTLNEYFTQVVEGSTEYNSFNSYINFGDGYFDIMREMDSNYSGTFKLLTEEPSFDIYNGAPLLEDGNGNVEEEEDEIVELTVNETPDFFRDTNNIGKKFSCLMFYQGIREIDDAGVTVPVYLFYWKHVNGISFSLLGRGVDKEQVFFDGESVRVTGTYVEVNPSPYYDFLISVDSMVSEQE